jgi:hypothetical protein
VDSPIGHKELIAWDTLDAEEQASWILVRSDSGTPFSSSTEELVSIVAHEYQEVGKYLWGRG